MPVNIKKYIPELAKIPVNYIYEPWKAPASVQEEAGCIIGKDYPSPMVKHKEASSKNKATLEELQVILMNKCNMTEPEHIKPSDESEVKVFFGLRSNEQ